MASVAELQAEGNRLVKDGDLEGAYVAYSRALLALEQGGAGAGPTKQSSMVSLLCNRSVALLKADRCMEAEADAARAVALDGSALKPHYRRACALKALGRHREAATACAVGLKLADAAGGGSTQLTTLKHECEEAAAAVAAAVETGSTSAAVAAPLSGEDAAVDVAEHDHDDDGDYATFCQTTANRLYGEGEIGQACAWYSHAISALEQAATTGGLVEEPRRLATLLSNRAATMLKLGRFYEAGRDCERGNARLPSMMRASTSGRRST